MLCRVLPVSLILALWGCGNSNTPARGTAAPAGPSVEAALEKLSESDPKDLKRNVANLEAALARDPDNVDGLMAMATATQYLARHPEKDEPTDALFHKSAEYVRRAMRAKKDAADDDEFRPFAANAMYNNACTFAREKKTSESLAALREAVDFGFSQLDLVQKNKELAAVRSAPEFAPFLKEAREKILAAAEKEVAHAFAETKPFEFNFDLEDVNGKKLSKADLAGKVLIVDIWGTWCPPCKMEIPHFVALDKQFREKGLQIVGLNSDEGEDPADATRQVRNFCRKEGVLYPCALITNEILEQVPDMSGFPTTLFLDRTGKVRMKVVGYHDISFLQLAVETLLNEKPADEGAKPDAVEG